MAQPVGNTTTPVISAQGLGPTNSKIEAGHIIVCPPEKMYKYSIYDELNLSKDSYKDLLNAVEPKKIKRQSKCSGGNYKE